MTSPRERFPDKCSTLVARLKGRLARSTEEGDATDEDGPVTEVSLADAIQRHLETHTYTPIAFLRLPNASEYAKTYVSQWDEDCKTMTQLPEPIKSKMGRGADDSLYLSCRAIARRYKELFSSFKTELGPFKMMAFLLEKKTPPVVYIAKTLDIVRRVKPSVRAQVRAAYPLDQSRWDDDKANLKTSLGSLPHKFGLFSHILSQSATLMEDGKLHLLEDLETMLEYSQVQRPDQEVADLLYSLYQTTGKYWPSDNAGNTTFDMDYFRRDAADGHEVHRRVKAKLDTVNIPQAISVALDPSINELEEARELIRSAEDYSLKFHGPSASPINSQLMDIVRTCSQEAILSGKQGTDLADHFFQDVVDWYVAKSWETRSAQEAESREEISQ